MKARCPECKRLVGIVKSVKGKTYPKHRTGRSNPKNVKPVCKASYLAVN